MVWGTSAARRRAPLFTSEERYLPPPGGAAVRREAPPGMAECGRCGIPVILVAGRLPDSWADVDGVAHCPDCRDPRSASAVDDHDPTKGAETTPSILGCRIDQLLGPGTVTLRIHAGAAPLPGRRDDPVHFLLTAAELDEVIDHLRELSAELSLENSHG